MRQVLWGNLKVGDKVRLISHDGLEYLRLNEDKFYTVKEYINRGYDIELNEVGGEHLQGIKYSWLDNGLTKLEKLKKVKDVAGRSIQDY